MQQKKQEQLTVTMMKEKLKTVKRRLFLMAILFVVVCVCIRLFSLYQLVSGNYIVSIFLLSIYGLLSLWWFLQYFQLDATMRARQEEEKLARHAHEQTGFIYFRRH
jgi:hypothetical protein